MAVDVGMAGIGKMHCKGDIASAPVESTYRAMNESPTAQVTLKAKKLIMRTYPGALDCAECVYLRLGMPAVFIMSLREYMRLSPQSRHPPLDAPFAPSWDHRKRGQALLDLPLNEACTLDVDTSGVWGRGTYGERRGI